MESRWWRLVEWMLAHRQRLIERNGSTNWRPTTRSIISAIIRRDWSSMWGTIISIVTISIPLPSVQKPCYQSRYSEGCSDLEQSVLPYISPVIVSPIIRVFLILNIRPRMSPRPNNLRPVISPARPPSKTICERIEARTCYSTFDRIACPAFSPFWGPLIHHTSRAVAVSAVVIASTTASS